MLLNGRRMVGDGGVDLGSIPAAAVERIEILKDGASAVYGSDAVAGVVNVILKKRFNGTELSAYAGTSSRGDANVYDLAATTGTGSEKGNLLFSLGLQKSGSLMAMDRNFSKQGVDYNFQTGDRSLTGNSSTFPAGRFTLPSAACSAAALAAITDPAAHGACARTPAPPAPPPSPTRTSAPASSSRPGTRRSAPPPGTPATTPPSSTPTRPTTSSPRPAASSSSRPATSTWATWPAATTRPPSWTAAPTPPWPPCR